jgi:hypothetical protein
MTPPAVLGAAYLTTRAFQGEPLERLTALVSSQPDHAARLHDQALLARLAFQADVANQLQTQALQLSRVFHVEGRPNARLRVLAVMLPGDLMANTPLDFMTQEADIRLDLLFHIPGQALPNTLPDHNIAFFAASDPTKRVCAELQAMFDIWPRPAINAPRFVPALERDTLSASLAALPMICSPPARRLTRQALLGGFDSTFGAQLIRPAGSHAGHGLERIETLTALTEYLAKVDSDFYYMTPFVDYRSADGMFRKYRVAFIDRVPFLCHMAISEHWMIHYLNAGMTESAAKRNEEGKAMATFSTDFARRHRDAFDALNNVIGLEYYSIDCAETPDGRLLVFEADNAAIIHMMDPPDQFAYKRPQMRSVFAAFTEMLKRRSAGHEGQVEKQSVRRLAASPVS